jgi:hypothetical protein
MVAEERILQMSKTKNIISEQKVMGLSHHQEMGEKMIVPGVVA